MQLEQALVSTLLFLWEKSYDSLSDAILQPITHYQSSQKCGECKIHFANKNLARCLFPSSAILLGGYSCLDERHQDRRPAASWFQRGTVRVLPAMQGLWQSSYNICQLTNLVALALLHYLCELCCKSCENVVPKSHKKILWRDITPCPPIRMADLHV